MNLEESDSDSEENTDENADHQTATMKFYKKFLFETEWGFLVLDEVQEAREPNTKRFYQAKRLPPMADHTLAMTATPLWNKPVDLLNILRVSGMDTSKSFPGWKEVPPPVKQFNGNIERDYEDCNRSYRRLAHFCLVLDGERRAIQQALKTLPSTHKDATENPLEDWNVLFPTECPEKAKPLKKKWDEYTQWNTWATVVVLDMARGRAIRRTREAHLDLWPHAETQVSLELYPELRIAYDKICEEQKAAGRVDEEGDDDKNDEEWLPQALEEISLGSSLPGGFDIKKRVLLVSPPRINSSYKELLSPKVEKAIKICKEILDREKNLTDKQKQKIAIYCEWTDPEVVDYIARRFKDAGIPLASLNGRMGEDSKARIIIDFQKDKDHKAICKSKSRILLFSQCISAGVNLHRASVLITLDNAWTFAKREQIEGRILRMGQVRRVSIYRLLCPNTIDEGMLFAQMRKSRLTIEMEKEWCKRATPFGPEVKGMLEKPACAPPGARQPSFARKRKGVDALPDARAKKTRKVTGGRKVRGG